MMIASKLHSGTHVPQPWHMASMTSALILFLASPPMKAWKGQTLTQRPQLVHRSALTRATTGSSSIVDWFRTIWARAADALAWVTLSLTSLGPSAQPAKETPSV